MQNKKNRRHDSCMEQSVTYPRVALITPTRTNLGG